MSNSTESKQTFNSDYVESELIKSLLLTNEAISEVSQIITSEDIENQKMREMYKSLLELNSRELPFTEINVISVMAEMEIPYINEDISIFYEEAPLESPIEFAKFTKELSVRREYDKLSKETSDDLKNGGNTLTSLMAMKSKMEDLSSRLIEKSAKSYQEAVNEFTLEILKEEVEDNEAIPSPYPTLNKYISGGFQGQQLVTVGARTGIGKTVFSTQCAAEACSQGKSVLYFSLEMGANELLKRFYACHGNILLQQLKPGAYRNSEVVERIKQVSSEVANWKLKIVDDEDITMEYISAVSQQTKQSQNGLDLIIIDYLQLISTKGIRKSNRQEIVAEISRACKMLARKLDCPVMILVQLNREDKKDDEERLPSKADIRESAAIAADSDIVVILHRKYRDDSPDPKALIILDKNRGGPSDKMIQVRCVLEKNIFQDIKAADELTNEESTLQENLEESQSEENTVAEDWGDTVDLAVDLEDDSDDFDLEDDWFGDL